ncbi:hypothetical protein [Rhodococcus sp. SJ-2]
MWDARRSCREQLDKRGEYFVDSTEIDVFDPVLGVDAAMHHDFALPVVIYITR